MDKKKIIGYALCGISLLLLLNDFTGVGIIDDPIAILLLLVAQDFLRKKEKEMSKNE